MKMALTDCSFQSPLFNKIHTRRVHQYSTCKRWYRTWVSDSHGAQLRSWYSPAYQDQEVASTSNLGMLTANDSTSMGNKSSRAQKHAADHDCSRPDQPDEGALQSASPSGKSIQLSSQESPLYQQQLYLASGTQWSWHRAGPL